MEEWLQNLTTLMESKDSMSAEEWKKALSAESYANEAELQKDIQKAEKEVNKRRKKDDGEAEEQEEEEPSFPLVDTPDAEVINFHKSTIGLAYAYFQLDEEGLKEKKKQKLMKAGWEARVRARKEKEREREEKEAEERLPTARPL